MIEQIAIPEERISIVIGKDGKTIELLSKRTKTMIIVDEIVTINGEPEDVFIAKDIITAIGRGFSPKNALRLLEEECFLEVITLQGETQNTIKRLMGRVIGKKGYSRKMIEQKTGAIISVFGKTVAIIGEHPGLNSAIKAVELLLKGKPHSYVYKMLEKSV